MTGDKVVENAAAQYSGTGFYSSARSFLYNRPSVSPYVNLATRDSSFGLPNYFTLVRPQVEQREAEMARQHRAMQMQKQITQIQDQVRQSQANDLNAMTTGKVGWSGRGMPRFGSTLNYYPGFYAAPRR